MSTQKFISDFNLQKINTKEYEDNLLATIDFGGNILAIARRGTGKTSISKQAIEKSKCKEIYLNLALMERPDLGGYPNFFGSKQGEKYINFLMPSIYKELIDGDQPCVALLDEIDKAEPGLLAPLLEFIQFRSVNGFKLKNLKAIIMTGNFQAEGGRRPPLPLLDRTEKFIVDIDARHWLEWGATTKEIHPSISAYIADNLDELCGDIEQNEAYADKSPRGWHNASRLIDFGIQHGWHRNMLIHKVSGCVGKQSGSRYAAFLEHYQVLLPVVDKIMTGSKVKDFDKMEKTKQLMTCMIVCSRYARMLDDAKDGINKQRLVETNANVVKFLSNVDPEIAVICIRGQIGGQRIIDHGLIESDLWESILDKYRSNISIQ